MTLFKDILNQKVSTSIVDLLPLVRCEENCFVNKNGQYVDLLRIVTKDLQSASDDETNFDIHRWTKFFRTFGDDVKILSLNFPTNTQQQREYVQQKIEKTKNEIYAYFLENKLAELEYIEKHRTNREYYLMIFSENLEKHRDSVNLLTKSLGGSDGGLVEQMPLEKKIQILFKINNKCTSIF